MKKVIKCIILIIALFLCFNIDVKAEEKNINTLFNNFEEGVKEFQNDLNLIYKEEYGSFETKLEPLTECETESCEQLGFINVYRKLNDVEELYMSFKYNEKDNYILYESDLSEDDDFDEDDYYDFLGKSGMVSYIIMSIAKMHGYTEEEFNRMNISYDDYTFENDGFEMVRQKRENDDGYVIYPTYLKISYDDNIRDFFDELIENDYDEDELSDTTHIPESSSKSTTKDVVVNSSTSIGKDSVITLLIVIVIGIICFAVKKLKKVEKNIDTN